MKNLFQNSLSISLHALSILMLLLPLVWFSGGLNWDAHNELGDKSQAANAPPAAHYAFRTALVYGR